MRALHPMLPFELPPYARTAADWQEELARILGRPVRVRFGSSRTVPVHAEDAKDGGLVVRLHRMFENAPAGVAEALGGWLRSGRRARRACSVLDEWIDRGLARLPPAPRGSLRARGRHHDLAAIGEELREGPLRDEFRDRSLPRVAWAARRASRARRSLLLGHYDSEIHVVRIHPVLDREDVPVWYLRFLVFHELLHAVFPSRREPSGRWIHHGPDFRRRERGHPDCERARRWEADNLTRLIRLARCAP